ncbi:MAG: Cell division protein FtsQ, partial [Chloroflexi bacterium]|nr:Cell division protein FtsQ [Chloroflexota bacterium]
MAVVSGTNLFALAAAPVEARVEALPGVAAATVIVSLPDTIVVRIEERAAILAWSVGERRFLVDRAGVLFAVAEPGTLTAAALPVIGDSRPAAEYLGVGDVLDPIDLDA